MKKILFAALTIALISNCYAQQPAIHQPNNLKDFAPFKSEEEARNYATTYLAIEKAKCTAADKSTCSTENWLVGAEGVAAWAAHDVREAKAAKAAEKEKH